MKNKCSVIGCTQDADQTWDICALGNKPNPICKFHDIKMNQMVLEFIGLPMNEITLIMSRYMDKMFGKASDPTKRRKRK